MICPKNQTDHPLNLSLCWIWIYPNFSLFCFPKGMPNTKVMKLDRFVYSWTIQWFQKTHVHSGCWRNMERLIWNLEYLLACFVFVFTDHLETIVQNMHLKAVYTSSSSLWEMLWERIISFFPIFNIPFDKLC